MVNGYGGIIGGGSGIIISSFVLFDFVVLLPCEEGEGGRGEGGEGEEWVVVVVVVVVVVDGRLL